MTEAELLSRFEQASLPNESFHHLEHVRVAWAYLERYPVLEALDRFSGALRRFAEAHGAPGLYHETITWAFFFLIQSRRATAPRDEAWEDFAARNPDLLRWKPSILSRYYTPETLASELARRVFLFPESAVGELAPA